MTASAVASIIHITDFHLGANAADTLLGLPTDDSFDDVIAHIKQHHTSIDLIVASGDLANHGSDAAYKRISEKMSAFSAPIVYVPGNHDDLALMQAHLSLDAYPLIQYIGGWCVIGLNSAQVDNVSGRIDAEQMRALKDILSTYHVPTLIVLHHPPVEINSAWIDDLGLADANEFLDVLVGFPQVKAVLCGHVHQDGVFYYQHLPIYTTPSTCIQFLSESEHFALDDRNPGYRWFDLFADGSITSGVVRVDGEYTVDHSAGGY